MHNTISLDTPPIAGSDVWRGPELAQVNSWISHYTAAELHELDAYAQAIDPQLSDPTLITRQDLKLPLLAKKFATARAQLEDGLGFQLIRGLPVDKYTDQQNRIIFWSLSLLVGHPDRQDKAGNRLHSVRDTGKDLKTDASARGYETSEELTFHNDGSDAFMLLCIKTAVSGGISKLVSVNHVYNEVLCQAPHLIETLQEDFHFDTREQHFDGRKIQSVPIFNFHAGKLSALYKRSYILSGQRFDDVPRLSDEQNAAIALIEKITRDESNQLTFSMQAGDIQLGNNYSILHSRTAYVDHERPEDKRHLLRTWLSLENGRPLPEPFAHTREFAQSYASRR